ncbi:uncharacterized protein CAALFM_C208990CA [Candida albicans SC5314]|uniref:Uncharacterized protein n=1 Tax=Candida albicans (strain SC5314 / ATCC MYA-2876) TaxID=237561 RepID=A0A1D8PID2_CANAL|nr:uncharacterized protein CAALFM_C208990CA [Candida albicans SC5314]AOW27887.1 hypothetical protein CAALFM_C208990CA [Candida albicans SC5314]|eukprot:XP_712590.2 hypothetical protein CAALFM_C208990CA [Candida albicans SC5314]
MLLNTAIHYWIFLLSIVSSSWIKYPIEISSIPGWHKEPTDIKEAQNVCDKDSEINNDLYCYPQCFNKEDDQPKLDRCCFNENGRVLYVSPCTVEPENEATTTEVAADQTETLPAADSTSAATSTVTADLEKYPQCFNKEDDQPKRENCCFDDNDRVLYPKPCYATSEDLVTTTDNATIETTSSVTTDLTSTTTTSTVDDVKKYPQCFNKKNDKPKRKHCCFDNDGKVLYPKPCSVTSKGSTTKTGDDTIIPTSSITTDSSSTTATSTIDDVKKYPQCFNKKNDKPKRKHCCFDNNDRVLYPKPCTKTSERTASTTAKNTTESESSSATTLPDSTTESESVSSTFTSDSSTESESISSNTTSDASDSTETHDINRYPRCFFKYSNQPNRSRCCFNSQYQVLYPWPCGGSSEDINASATDDSADEISQTTTDSSSTATDIEDGDDENNDMKEYPQCFNKQDDQPKREHCCFDDNDRVLYPKPCGSSDDANTSSTDDSTDEISQTTTDSSSTATGIDDGDDENNDMKEYPQCFNKKDDQPKREHCCFDDNDRVLYPKPCSETSETSESETTTIGETTTESESVSVTTSSDDNIESESISSTTTSDASDSTETHDINRYPHCFFKYSNQPNKDRCCFNSRYQVLYPWPCDGSSQSTTTTVSISISGTESSSVTTTFDENLGTSSELTISSSSDLISTSQDIPQATTINNSTTSIESSANGSTLPLTQPILSVSEFESSVSDATNSNSNSNPTFTAEGGHSSDEMLRTTDKNNSLTSKSVATPTETSWLNSVAGTSSKEDMRTSTGTISSFSEVATTEMISSPSETGNPKKSSAIDYGTNSDITTSTGRYTSLRDKTVSTLQEDAGIESTTVEGITKTVHTTVYVTTSPDNSITTETAVVVVVTNDSTATTYTEIIQTTVVEGKTLTTAIPIPQDEINKIKVIEYSTILPTTLPNGQVTSVIEKVAVAVNGQGQKVTKTAPIELGAYTTKGFEIIQDSNDIGNSVAEGYNPSAGLGGSTLVAPIAVVSNENSASLPKVNSLLVKFLLLVLLIV